MDEARTQQGAGLLASPGLRKGQGQPNNPGAGKQGRGQARGDAMGHTEQGAILPEHCGIPMLRTCHCQDQWCMHHRALRARWTPYVLSGRMDCWRCGQRIRPDQLWDLGHDDTDKRRYRGPECRPCNRSTSSRRKATPEPNRWIL